MARLFCCWALVIVAAVLLWGAACLCRPDRTRTEAHPEKLACCWALYGRRLQRRKHVARRRPGLRGQGNAAAWQTKVGPFGPDTAAGIGVCLKLRVGALVGI